ncbi:MAG TPA: ankyrin repeat domain-containing protein [Thermoanaerobaculia bacterium]|nr:ankyrin repeat domain-containing protein [Thermoanaerobaculia bacterium]
MRGKEILGKMLLAAACVGVALLVATVVLLGFRGQRSRSFPPLHLAARSGSVQAVTVLLDSGVGPEELDRGPNGWTPLLHAIHKDQLAVVRLLLARGADPNRLAVNGTSPLNLAASQGDLVTVRTLIAAGARVEGRSGISALLNAATGGHRQVVETLLTAAPGLRVPAGPRYWVARLLAHLRGDREMLALLARVERRS